MSLDNVKHIILVLSGKGGVGKSSITTQLALSLSLAGHPVGILDTDLTGPSIPRLLNLEAATITQAPGGWLPALVHAAQTLPPLASSAPGGPHAGAAAADEGPRAIGALYCMSLAFLLKSRDEAVVWRGPKKTAMVRQFLSAVLWPPLDYLLIDTPPGTSDEHIALAEALLRQAGGAARVGGAVVVTTPQAVAVSDVRKEMNFCGKVGLRVVGVVENMSGFVCGCCGVGTNVFGSGGGEVMSGEFGVGFLGRVELDAQWGRLVEEGRRPRYGRGEGGEEGEGEERDEGLLVDKYRSCSLWKTFEGIAGQVVDIVEGGGGGSG